MVLFLFQVYLDVKFALDPEIKFEVELLPPRQVTGCKPLSDSGSSSSEACRSNSQEEAATEDERHENLAGDTACSDKC